MTPATPKLLLVEDDPYLASLLLEYLEQNGFIVEHQPRGDTAIETIHAFEHDLVILDLMLPGVNGLDVLKAVRPDFSGAILMLTASQSEVDHVMGLELGADDFVIKPIDPRVLIARIRTQLRRRHPSPAPKQVSQVCEVGSLRIDTKTRDVTWDRMDVPVTTMEFDVLIYLAERAGSVVDRESLYRDVMGIEYDGIDRGLDIHVSRLRKKLVACGFNTSRLKSVRGIGYLLALR